MLGELFSPAAFFKPRTFLKAPGTIETTADFFE